MMPIVFITKMDGGGMETFCIGLLRAWSAQGIATTLYSSYSGGVRNADVPPGVERVCWNTRARDSFWRVAKWLKTRPDDPCLALSQELAIVLIVLRKLHFVRNKIYFRESTDVERHYGNLFKRLMRWMWPSLDGIIEQSWIGVEATRQICKGHMPPSIVVRNIMEGNNLSAITPFVERDFIRLVCAGGFKLMKGQKHLVEELAEDLKDDWRLTFWGDGERRAQVEQLVKDKGLSGKVQFHGWVPDKSKIYSDCDVVVIPSDYEGLPNVMLEAMFYGKRVSVRPTCVGACELLGELGIGETWPWRKALDIPDAEWKIARERLIEICDPEKVGTEILSFMLC